MEQIIKECAEQAKDVKVYNNPLFPPSLYYRFFKLLASRIKPSLSVELGVCGGGGSLHLALGYPRGQVVGIDHSWDHPEQISHIRKACPNFKFIIGDSCKEAQRVYFDYGHVDILFIDTDHTRETTLREFNTWKPYLKKDAIVCFDDLFRPGMDDTFKSLPGTKLYLNHLKGGERNDDPVQEGGFGVIYDIP